LLNKHTHGNYVQKLTCSYDHSKSRQIRFVQAYPITLKSC